MLLYSVVKGNAYLKIMEKMLECFYTFSKATRAYQNNTSMNHLKTNIIQAFSIFIYNHCNN